MDSSFAVAEFPVRLFDASFDTEFDTHRVDTVYWLAVRIVGAFNRVICRNILKDFTEVLEDVGDTSQMLGYRFAMRSHQSSIYVTVTAGVHSPRA